MKQQHGRQEQMSSEATREAMTGYLAALIEREGYERYLAQDVVLSVVGTDLKARGRGAVQAVTRYLCEEAFDASPEFRRLLFDEGRAAVEADFVGTYTGGFGGNPAAGGEVGVPYVVMYDLDGGMIRAIRVYVSVQLLLAQIEESSIDPRPLPTPENRP